MNCARVSTKYLNTLHYQNVLRPLWQRPYFDQLGILFF